MTVHLCRLNSWKAIENNWKIKNMLNNMLRRFTHFCLRTFLLEGSPNFAGPLCQCFREFWTNYSNCTSRKTVSISKWLMCSQRSYTTNEPANTEWLSTPTFGGCIRQRNVSRWVIANRNTLVHVGRIYQICLAIKKPEYRIQVSYSLMAATTAGRGTI